MCYRAAKVMLATGQPVQAESLLRRSMKIYEANWGANHPEVADCLSKLASVLEAGGRLLEAEQLRRHSLEIVLTLSRSANRAHPDLKVAINNYENILLRMGRTSEQIKSVLHELAPDFTFPEVQELGQINKLALRLYHAGKVAEAESLLRKVLAKSGQSGAADEDEIPATLDVLGQCLKHLKRYTGAEAVMRHSLEIRSKPTPQDTSQTAVSLNNLGQLLYCVKRYQEAQPLLQNALDILENDHPDNRQLLIAVLNNLAQLHKDEGRLTDAEQLLRRAVSIIPDEQAIGSDILLPVENLARLLKDTGRLAEAEQWMRGLVARCEKIFGPESQNVSDAIKNLILFFKETEHLDDAVPLFRRLLAIDEKNLGQDHLDIATDLRQYASVLVQLNRLDEVEPLFKRIIWIAEKKFGNEAPEVARELSILGSFLCAIKRQREAEPFFKREMLIYLKLSRTTGILRPELKECFTNYFGLLGAMGCSLDQILSALCEIAPEYFALDSEQYKALEGIFGRDYFQVIQNWTLRHWNNYSALLRKQGRADLADPISRRVAATTARVLGDSHPLAINRYANLVLTLILLGKLEEARQILAANWRLNAPPHANTTPRIAFLRHLITRLESQPDTPFLGQLKTLLTGPELPVASDVAVPWDIGYFIEFLKPKLGEHNAEFLTALVAALNDRTKLSALDPFPEWRNQPSVSLDTPWPSR